MRIVPLGDQAVTIELGEAIAPEVLAHVHALTHALRRQPLAGVSDVVPAFATVTVFYDPARVGTVGPLPVPDSPYERVCRWVTSCADIDSLDAAELKGSRTLEIPVCYGGKGGPDLAEVADRAHLSPEEVVARHSAARYLVYAVGFTPGFAYLGGLPAELHTPRRATPRARVPAGSVGIGGAQTGVYPLVSPGGWNLIGRTPLPLFRADAAEPAVLRAGDTVKFRTITEEEFAAWK